MKDTASYPAFVRRSIEKTSASASTRRFNKWKVLKLFHEQLKFIDDEYFHQPYLPIKIVRHPTFGYGLVCTRDCKYRDITTHLKGYCGNNTQSFGECLEELNHKSLIQKKWNVPMFGLLALANHHCDSLFRFKLGHNGHGGDYQTLFGIKYRVAYAFLEEGYHHRMKAGDEINVHYNQSEWNFVCECGSVQCIHRNRGVNKRKRNKTPNDILVTPNS